MLAYVLLASAISGALAKICDDYQDRGLSLAPILVFFLSIIYGLLLGLLSAYTTLASLFLALVFANALSQKIDGVHIIALCSFCLVVLNMGLFSFDPWIFSLLLFCAILDEINLRIFRPLNFLFENRLCVPIGATIASFLLADVIFLASIIAFDILYKITDHMILRHLQSKSIKK